jgi:hypothetical protein
MDGFHGGAVPDDGEIFIPCFDCPMLGEIFIPTGMLGRHYYMGLVHTGYLPAP